MMKATAENIWVDQDAQKRTGASTVAFSKWFNRLRHFRLQNVLQRMVVPKQSYYGMWESLIRRQQQKAQIIEQSFKDDFFYDGDYAMRKNIPHKTWKRHSAFLVYRHKVNNLKSTSILKTDSRNSRTVDELSAAKTRISFQVKSIRPLPVWATALNELSVIENDLSSLRLMEIRTIQNFTAEAA